jgi:hypothetical protein
LVTRYSNKTEREKDDPSFLAAFGKTPLLDLHLDPAIADFKEDRKLHTMLSHQPVSRARDLLGHAARGSEFRLNPSRAHRLVVGQRLVVNIPDGAFCDAAGEPATGPVRFQVELLEHLTELVLHGLPTLFQGYVFDCWGQILVQAWQGMEPLRWREPLQIQWLPAGRQPVSTLQLLHASPQWTVQPPSRLRLERPAGSFGLQVTLSDPGFWMIGTARVSELAGGLFSLRPQGLPGEVSTQRAILLFDRCQGFAELQATPRGFTGWRLPVQPAGQALVWTRFQDQWIGGTAPFHLGRDKVVPVSIGLQPAFQEEVQLLRTLLPQRFSPPNGR